jgi:16S rRNA (cytosine1402-N4)-methyltransferase
MQMDNPARGFTFKSDGPLDLRLNPSKGQPASALLDSLDETSLAALLTENADEPHAVAIAQAIRKQARPVTTTRQLASIIKETVQRTARGLTAEEQREEIRISQQRTFQALRIAVNDELGVLDQFLQQLPEILKPGGRAVILSFHSGEDRRVKKSFLGGLRSGMYQQIAPDPVRPSPEERRDNPRCACAKLRWAVRATKQTKALSAP